MKLTLKVLRQMLEQFPPIDDDAEIVIVKNLGGKIDDWNIGVIMKRKKKPKITAYLEYVTHCSCRGNINDSSFKIDLKNGGEWKWIGENQFERESPASWSDEKLNS